MTTITTSTHSASSYQGSLHSMDLDMDPEDGHIEPDMDDTSHMRFVDGRCSCCPYGYHIDLDFLRFSESMNDATNLRKLRKIKSNKRKLRKSMEVFLEQQQKTIEAESATPPPEAVKSADNFLNLVEYEDSATSKLLEEIDSSVNQTLSSIDHLMYTGKRQYTQNRLQQVMEKDSEDDTDASSPTMGFHYGRMSTREARYRAEMERRYLLEQQSQQCQQGDLKYRSETELQLSPSARKLAVTGKTDSVSSLSSTQSTHSSDPSMSMHSSSSSHPQTYTSTHHMLLTSDQLAGNLAQLLPSDDTHHYQPSTDTGSSMERTSANISSAQLAAIREQMALSLQRLRELEEQVKAIPVLQVRISVLKEEKRLLMLQLKAKNNKLNMRSVGVGDARIDDYDWVSSGPRSLSPTGKAYELNSFRQINVTQHETGSLLRPKPSMRTIGIGDGNVFENYQVTTVNGALTTESQVRERELHTEQNTHVVEKEKEIQTLVIGQGGDRIEGKFLGWGRRLNAEKEPKRVPTRSIGVGEGDVFDANSNVHVHQKEMRTVIIGGKEQHIKATRNVGILCKAAMRDVGVTYMIEDSIPSTRTIAVGVGEIGVGEGEYGLMEGGDGMSGGTTLHQYTSLNQMNMAAFHTRNINIKHEDLLHIVNTVLKKTVHSVGVQVRFSTEDKSVNHVGYDMLSVGCGSDSVDVEVRPVVKMKSVGIDNRPSMLSKSGMTDQVFTRNEATNTKQYKGSDKAVATVPLVMYPATTNTDNIRTYDVNTETDLKIFQAMDQIKNCASNTDIVRTRETGIGTEQQEKLLKQDGFEMEIRFVDKGINTSDKRYTLNKGMNTDSPRMRTTGVGDWSVAQKVECDLCQGKPKVANASSVDMMHEDDDDDDEQQESQESVDVQSQQTLSSPTGESRRVITREVRTTRGLHHLDDDMSGDAGGSVRTVIERQTTSRRSPGVSRRSPISEADLLGGGGTTVTKTSTINSSGDGSDMLGGSRTVTERTVSSSRRGGAGLDIDADMLGDGTVGSRRVVARTVTTSRRGVGGLETESSMLGGGDGGSSSSGVSYSSSGGGSGDMSEGSGSRRVVTQRTVTSSKRGVGDIDLETDMLGGGSRTGGGSMSTRKTVITTSSLGGGGLETESSILGGGGLGGGSTITRKTVTTSSSRGGAGLDMEADMLGQGLTGQTTTSRQTVRTTRGGDGLLESVSVVPGRQKIVTERTVRSSGGGFGLESSERRHSQGSEGSDNQENQNDGEQQKGDKMSMTHHVETSYSDGRSSSGRLGKTQEPEESNVSVETTTLPSGGSSYSRRTVRTVRHGGSPGGLRSETVTTTTSGGTSTRTKNVDITYPNEDEDEERSGTVSSAQRHTESGYRTQQQGWKSEDSANTRSTKRSSGLKSIMKRPSIDDSSKTNVTRKEISFAEGVVGGYVSSSEDEGEGSGDSDASGSSQSYDEGSYDGREGKISYSCQDDQAIAEGAPGAQMYDQNIRETYELSSEMRSACQVYAEWLQDSTLINTKQLNASLNLIQSEWFKASSHKLSSPAMVEDFLSSFKEISTDLLGNVVNLADANGNTALHYAVSHGNMEIVRMLLDTGILSVNKQNRAGYTAIMLASLAQITMDDQREVVRKLFNMGDVNMRASQAGQTALMLAVSHGRAEMVKLLLECDADVNAQDDDGSTALMCASEHGHAEIVKMLLGHPDCDASLEDNDGSTALSIAMEAGHRDVGVLLYAHVNFKPTSPVVTRAKTAKTMRKTTSSISTSPRLIRR